MKIESENIPPPGNLFLAVDYDKLTFYPKQG